MNSRAYRIYNKQTKIVMESINVVLKDIEESNDFIVGVGITPVVVKETAPTWSSASESDSTGDKVNGHASPDQDAPEEKYDFEDKIHLDDKSDSEEPSTT